MKVSIIPYGSRFAAVAVNGAILATHVNREKLEYIADKLYRQKNLPSDPNPTIRSQRPVGSILFKNNRIIFQNPS